MAGKHSAGGNARKTNKILPAAIAAVVIIALAGGLGWWMHSRSAAEPEEAIPYRPGLTEGAEEVPFRPDLAGEEEARPVVPESSVSAAEEIPLPEGDPGDEEAFPVTGADMRDDFPGDGAEEIRISGSGVPEADAGDSTEPETDGGETMEPAELVLRLEAGAGQTRHVYVQRNPGGMTAAEYITEGDVIVASAESTYASVAGLDDGTVESLAMGFTMTGVPAGYEEDAELLWERQGDWLIMVTVLHGLDDPAKLEAFGDGGLMRIVSDDSYTLTEAEDFLLGLGYEKQ